jgi:hypothetical protein
LINFHLLCKNCQKSRSYWLITPIQRQIFTFAQQLSPSKFVEFARSKKDEVKDVSGTLKKIISNILGKEIGNERFLMANP